MDQALDQHLVPPRQARGRLRLESVVAAGLRLVRDRSLDDLTMQDIAGEAGCSVGNLYKRFPSKDDLLVILVESATETVTKRIAEHYSPDRAAPRDLAEAVRRIVAFQISIVREYRGLFRAIRSHILKSSGEARISLKAPRQTLFEAERGLIAPFVRMDDAAERRLRFILQASMANLLDMSLFATGWVTLEDDDVARQTEDMILAYLRKTPRAA